MAYRKKQVLSMGIFSVAIVILLVGSVIFYNGYIYNKMLGFTSMTLNEIAIQQASQFSTKFKSDMASIELLATDMSRLPASRGAITEDTLKESLSKTNFDYMTVLGSKGNGYTDEGRKVSYGDREFFRRSMAGETFISTPVLSTTEDKGMVIVSTPIMYEGEAHGVLMGIYFAERLSELFFPSFGGEGYAYILNNNGTVISSAANKYSLTSKGNLFDSLSEADFSSGHSYEQFRNNIENELPGEARYRYENQNRVMRYMPININCWSIVSVIPEAAVSDRADEITAVTLLISTVIIGVFVAMMIRAQHIQRRNLSVLEGIAYVDDLTGAPTLAKFKLEAQRFIDENPSKKLLMVKFDIDKFKLINEILGQEVGDQVIINLAKALKMNISVGYERYCRVHDDEFMVLHEYEQVKELIEIRDRYQTLFAQLMGDEFDYNTRMVSGHYYMDSEKCKNAIQAIEKANIAHRRAKQTGDEVYIYDEKLIKEAIRKKDIEERMYNALETGEFKVFLQPQYSLTDESITGAEALVRWKSDNKDMIFPDEFIPIFEENGFITSLDMYMFKEACSIISGWVNSGAEPVVISVNFSRKHLPNSRFVDILCEIADSYGVNHKYLGIEITEGIFFDNKEVLLDVLEKLHTHSFTLIMDDFGTGYSSLGMLKNIPVDVIKIDKSFFDNMEDEERAQVVLGYMIKMAQMLDITTVSEGVETKEMVDTLKKFGCDIAQGYYYARPMAAELFTKRFKCNNVGEDERPLSH